MRSSNDCAPLLHLRLQNACDTEIDHLQTPILVDHDVRSCAQHSTSAFIVIGSWPQPLQHWLLTLDIPVDDTCIMNSLQAYSKLAGNHQDILFWHFVLGCTHLRGGQSYYLNGCAHPQSKGKVYKQTMEVSYLSIRQSC